METNVRAKGPKAFIAKICAVLFLLIMIVLPFIPSSTRFSAPSKPTQN